MGQFAAACFRSRLLSAACLALLAAVYLLPLVGGGGFRCLFREATHLPCLACGLTRSLAAAAHLRLAEAAFYHPLGLLLFPALAGGALLLLAPRRVRRALAAWAEPRDALWAGLALVFLILFAAYGFGRVAWVLAGGTPSPW